MCLALLLRNLVCTPQRRCFAPLPYQWCHVTAVLCFVLFSLQVNIIPIIAKADTIAKNELHKFKSKIMSELVSNGVQIYQFPTDEETVAEINATMSVSLPCWTSSTVAFAREATVCLLSMLQRYVGKRPCVCFGCSSACREGKGRDLPHCLVSFLQKEGAIPELGARSARSGSVGHT